MEMNILLAAYKCARVDIACLPKKPSGRAYVVGDDVDSAKPSKHRKAGDRAPVRLSAVAILPDKLLVRKRVGVFLSDKNLYAEIDDIPFLVNESGIHIRPADTGITQSYFLWAYVLYHGFITKDSEFSKTFTDIVNVYRLHGVVDPKDMASLCDSFYYYHTENKKLTIEVTGDLVLETVEAAFRSGAITAAVSGFKYDSPRLVRNEGPLEEVKKEGSAAENSSTRPVSIFEEAKSGKYLIDYEWSEEARKRITPLKFLETYVPNEIFFKALKKLSYRLGNVLGRMKETEDYQEALGRWDHVEMSMIGTPGSGKTITVYALSAALGIPVWEEDLSHNTDEDAFQGKTKLVQGKPMAVPTEVLEGVEQGGIVLLEEVNLPQAAVVMGALGQCVEYPFTLKKDGYETIHRHPLCVFVSTMNVGTAGSKAVSEPFSNRFRTSYLFEDAERKEFVETLMKTSGMKKYICEWVYDTYSKIVEALKSTSFGAADTESILLSLSLRSCEGVLQGIEEGLKPKEAVYDSLVNKIAERDLVAAEQVRDLVDAVRDLHIEGEVRDV